MNNVYKGSRGFFAAVLQANGQDYAPPAGYTLPKITWTTDGDGATTSITASADTQTATLAVDAGESGTVVNIFATCTAPDGKQLSATFQVAILTEPQVFTLQIIQTGFEGPLPPAA